MKRILVFLLVLMLLCPAALADTVREQVNAPARITDIFYSNTGKTTVQIDADVTVPQTDRVPVYFITPRLFTAEEMTRAADILLAAENGRVPLNTSCKLAPSMMAPRAHNTAHSCLPLSRGRASIGPWAFLC